VGQQGADLGMNGVFNGANCPQKPKEWYNYAGLFPLWITAVRTAVKSFEGLKPSYRNEEGHWLHVRTAVKSFEGLKQKALFCYEA
jgi:hypothetical protein